MSIEYAAGQHDHDIRSAALRNAPGWVRRRIGGENSHDEPPTGGAVLGVWQREPDGSARRIYEPPGPPPRTRSAEDRGRSGNGAAVTWSPTSPHRPGALTTRVWLVAAHGDAMAAAIDLPRSETIAPAAFGKAADLNREGLVRLVGVGHDGFTLSQLGRGLVAHDSEVGLVLRWTPDQESVLHREAVARIEAGAGCSVYMTHRRSDVVRLPAVDVVTRAALIHVAIVPRNAYRGAIAKVFRQSHVADEAEMREQLARVVREAKFSARHTWSRT